MKLRPPKAAVIAVSILAFSSFLPAQLRAQPEPIPKCVWGCDGGGSGSSGGGWSRPSRPSGPSPAERERQRRVREATDLNQQGVKLWAGGDFTGALEKYRRAAQLEPEDKVIRANVAGAESMIAWRSRNFTLAYAKAQEALGYHRADVFSQLLGMAVTGLEEEKYERNVNPGVRQEMERITKTIRNEQRIAGAPAQEGLEFLPSTGLPSKASSSGNASMTQPSAAPKDALSFMRLEAFPPGNPPNVRLDPTPRERPAEASDPSKVAGRELKSAAADGALAASLSGERASEQARQVFDKPGMAAVSLDTLTVVPRNSAGDPIVPKEKRTPRITLLERQRDEARETRSRLEKELQQLEAGPVTPDVAVRIATKKQDTSTLHDKENFINFMITDELKGPSSGGTVKENRPGARPSDVTPHR